LPFLTANGVRLFYRLEGSPANPVLVFSHSIGTDHAMWAPQAADLLPHFRILRYDTRGHGASDSPPGEYSVETLSVDLLALADALTVDRFAFCGLSMGGAIGQWIAINAPERLTSLVLANTTPQFSPRSNWETRIQKVSQGGMASIADLALRRFFSPEALARPEPHVESIRSVLLGTNPVGYLGCCAALRDVDFRQQLASIRTPALIVSADRDVSTPWQGHNELLARDIHGAKVVHLPAAHLSNLERPRSFTAALVDFLIPKTTPESAFDAGLVVRRAMLGDTHVDRALANATDLYRDFQELITRYAWGSVWTRPLLDRRTRRLLVLATMAAAGRWEEFRMHLRAALERELEPCDLKELLLQTAIYAGVPAANTGFKIAAEVVDELREQK
jgi:3-oxoadipate enol-lactonase / 4-carboxymuconolactone decarboxylase